MHVFCWSVSLSRPASVAPLPAGLTRGSATPPPQANPLVRAALEEQGEGRVLVVDGGASTR